MNKSLFLDTCIIIDALRGNEQALRYLDGLERQPLISVIVEMELLAGARNKRELKVVERFVEGCGVIDVPRDTCRHAGNLLMKHQGKDGVQPTDALIAATALEYDGVVVTKNRKHFVPTMGEEAVLTPY